MNIKDVTIVSFNFEQGYKTPTVKALVQLDVEGNSDINITWTDLNGEEIDAIVKVARLVEQRLQTGNSLASKENLDQSQEIESVRRQLAKRYSNLFRLEEQAAEYGASQIPLSIHNGIDGEKKAITELEERLRAIQNISITK